MDEFFSKAKSKIDELKGAVVIEKDPEVEKWREVQLSLNLLFYVENTVGKHFFAFDDSTLPSSME